MRLTWVPLALLAVASAQAQSTVTAPVVSGFAYDRADRSLRVIAGIPGAARLSERVLTGIDAAWVAPDGAAALAVTDGTLELVRGLKEEKVARKQIGERAPARVVWAADGSAAALYFRDTARVETLLVSGEGYEWHSTHAAEGEIGALAVAPGARTVAFGAGEVLVIVEPQQDRRTEIPVRASAAIFAEGRLLVAEGPRVLAWHGGAALEPVAVELDGASRIVSMAADEGRVWLLDEGARSLVVWDAATGAVVQRTAVPVEASELRPLSGGRHLLVTARSKSSEPLFVADGAEVFFVPAAQ